jgi:DNA-binding CsgD family transcriptional regulator
MPVKVEGGLPLTNRELETALLAARGMRSVPIARLLFISTRTIYAHLRNVYVKAGVANRVQLVNWLLVHAPATETGP